jgi:hypothetical protein
METKDFLTLIGWPVSCLLSILAGGYIIPNLTRKRRVLSWATVSESELIPSDLADTSAIPIKVEINGVSPRSVTLVTIRVGNSGNDMMEKISVAISANPACTIHYLKPTEDLGEFCQHIDCFVEGSKGKLAFAFLNPGTAAEFELLVSNYDEGSIAVDCSGPGIEVRRQQLERWQVSTSVLRSVGLSFIGVRYDPSAASLLEIATELKAIRRSLRDK